MSDIPVFKIGLEVPPGLRWIPVAYHFREPLAKVVKSHTSELDVVFVVGSTLLWLTSLWVPLLALPLYVMGAVAAVFYSLRVLAMAASWSGWKYPHREEIGCFANVCQVAHHNMLFTQLLMFFTHFGASAVVRVGGRWQLFHSYSSIRSHALAVRLDVYDGDRLLYSAVSTAGWMGVHTAVSRTRHWAASTHYRESSVLNILLTFLRLACGAKWLSPFALRHALESDMEYDAALAFLSRAATADRAFTVMLSPRQDKAVALAHSRWGGGVDNSFTRRPTNNVPLVACSHDWWDTRPVRSCLHFFRGKNSRDRHAYLVRATLSPSNFDNVDQAVAKLCRAPVLRLDGFGAFLDPMPDADNPCPAVVVHYDRV